LKKKETKNSRKTRSLRAFFHANSRQKPLAVICSHLTIFWTPDVATLKQESGHFPQIPVLQIFKICGGN
jgi:hypothetical protein